MHLSNGSHRKTYFFIAHFLLSFQTLSQMFMFHIHIVYELEKKNWFLFICENIVSKNSGHFYHFRYNFFVLDTKN